jgi:hypothetical protein
VLVLAGLVAGPVTSCSGDSGVAASRSTSTTVRPPAGAAGGPPVLWGRVGAIVERIDRRTGEVRPWLHLVRLAGLEDADRYDVGAAVSPDGDVLLVAVTATTEIPNEAEPLLRGDQRIVQRLYRVSTSRPDDATVVADTDPSPVRSGPDGRWFAGVQDGRLVLLPGVGGPPVDSGVSVPYAEGIAWSADGTRLAVGGNSERDVGSTAVVEVDARTGRVSGSGTVAGSRPWIDAAGVVRTSPAAGPWAEVQVPGGAVLGRTADAWVWWPADGGPSTARPLGPLPAGFVPLTW